MNRLANARLVKQKVLLNATTLPTGGVIQACVSFINMSLELSNDIEWIYVVSSKVKFELDYFDTAINDKKLIVFDESPAKSYSSRRKLFNLAEELAPDAIFTFFGPAYVKFKQPHLCGVADGWVTHSTWIAYQSIRSNLDKLKIFLRCVYSGYWFRYADKWVTEADCSKNGLIKRVRVPQKDVYVVRNTCASHYTQMNEKKYDTEINGAISILTLSSYYPHKNLEIIPYIAKELTLMGYCDFQFIITINKGSPEETELFDECNRLKVSGCLLNLGPVNIIDGPALYDAVDIVLQSSLLESFSANYPEAMARKKPIVATDLAFVHDICQDAAMYYPPKNAKAAAKCISKLISDQALVHKLTEKGSKVLANLPTSRVKYFAYEAIIKDLLANAKQ